MRLLQTYRLTFCNCIRFQSIIIVKIIIIMQLSRLVLLVLNTVGTVNAVGTLRGKNGQQVRSLVEAPGAGEELLQKPGEMMGETMEGMDHGEGDDLLPDAPIEAESLAAETEAPTEDDMMMMLMGNSTMMPFDNSTMMPSDTDAPTEAVVADAKEGHAMADDKEEDMGDMGMGDMGMTDHGIWGAGAVAAAEKQTMGPSGTMGPSNATMYEMTDAPTDAIM